MTCMGWNMSTDYSLGGAVTCNHRSRRASQQRMSNSQSSRAGRGGEPTNPWNWAKLGDPRRAQAKAGWFMLSTHASRDFGMCWPYTGHRVLGWFISGEMAGLKNQSVIIVGE